jgi:hypothetical protein
MRKMVTGCTRQEITRVGMKPNNLRYKPRHVDTEEAEDGTLANICFLLLG